MGGSDNPAVPDPTGDPPPPVPDSQGPPAPYGYAQPAYPYGGPPPYDQPFPYQQTGNGVALTSMVLGLVGVVLSWLPIFDFVFAVLAIVFGTLGISSADRRGGAGKGMAVAGVVLGVVTLAISIAMWVFIYATLNSCYGAGC
ncbi:MAG: DUF4190 domain-containing protein [Candidatus Dormibacteria bacterium]